ncbi:uncharacterized protein AMSG_05989 [Thecamonas trahens ATCC 50062]|uniref:Uncharacterized protein n=1 Tax=Thecamonas trahens ATCC 50062 TaxID=461836 RepID=A0A0L0DBK8_THETB|nr:hypothetical protein AMSG_05989 [Thecamonas trahens ATCC 50062]KNC49722.1 hypothetical protein AMSG_05989 [Thecamonas trahens ATCC 50062]|eukprot:XP_013757513.1 hypothetical protein AMSG_05989 [Thecamonas trahens ATCC 50062]
MAHSETTSDELFALAMSGEAERLAESLVHMTAEVGKAGVASMRDADGGAAACAVAAPANAAPSVPAETAVEDATLPIGCLSRKVEAAVRASDATLLHSLLKEAGASEGGVDELMQHRVGGGRTLLHLATASDDFYCTSLLVEAGFDVAAVDDDGATPVDLTDQAMVRGYLAARSQ